MEKKNNHPCRYLPPSVASYKYIFISVNSTNIHSSRNKCKLHFSLFFTFIVVVFIYLNASKTKVREKMNIRTGEKCSAYN